YFDSAGIMLGGDYSETYADDGTPTGAYGEMRATQIDRFTSDGMTVSSEWSSLVQEFPWLVFDETLMSVMVATSSGAHYSADCITLIAMSDKHLFE